MPFLLAEILNFQGSTHHIGVGSFSYLYYKSNRPGLQTAAKGPLQDSVCICLHPCILCAILYTGFYEKTRKLT